MSDNAAGTALAGEALMRAYVAIQADTKPLDDALSRLPAKVDAASRRAAASTKSLNVGLDGVTNSAQRAGYRMQVFAQTMDDVQYISASQGLRSVGNNLIQMNPLLGLAAIGVDSLVKSTIGWAKILDMGHTKSEAERMEELEKATDRTAAATQRLTKYKEQQATIERQAAAKSEVQKKQASTVDEAIAESAERGGVGGNARLEHIIRGIVQTDRARLISRDTTGIAQGLQGKIDKLYQQKLYGAGYNQIRAQANLEKDPEYIELNRQLEDRVRERAKQALADAANDPDKLKALIKQVEANPGSFPKGFATQLREATPEGQKAIQDWEQEGEDWNQSIEDQKRRKAIREEKAKKLKAEIDPEAEKRAKAFEQKYGADIIGEQQNRTGKFAPLGLRTKIREELFQGGVGDPAKLTALTETVATKLLKSIEDKVEDYSISHNVDRATAQEAVRQTMEKEQADKLRAELKARMGPAPTMHSLDSYLSGIQQKAFDAQDPLVDIGKTQIKIMETIAANTAKRTTATYK